MSSLEIIDDQTIEVSISPPTIVEIDIQPSPVIEVEITPGAESSVEVTQFLTEIEIVPPSIVDVDVTPPNLVEIEVFPGGVVYRTVDDSPVYKEFVYTGDNLTLINTWDNSDKDNFLFSTELNYSGDNLIEKVVTNQLTTEIRTTTYVYSGDNLVSYSEVTS